MSADSDCLTCTYCGSRVDSETIFEHMQTCCTAMQERAIAELCDRFSTTGELGENGHSLPGEAARLPLSAVTGIFRDETPAPGKYPDASEVIPGLFLGNIVAAKSVPWLSGAGVKLILNCAKEASILTDAERDEAGVGRIVRLALDDVEDARHIRTTLPVILSGARELGASITGAGAVSVEEIQHLLTVGSDERIPAPAVDGVASPSPATRALVHCAVGRSRSATTLITYLMLFRGVSLISALTLVKARRPLVLPNAGFLAILVAIEERIAEFRAACGATSDGAGAVSEPTAEGCGASAAPAHARTPCSVHRDILATHSARMRRFDAYSGRALPGTDWAECLEAAYRAADAALAAGL